MNEKLKRQILFEATNLLHNRKVQDFGRARIEAARRVSRGWIHPSDLPHPREIRDLLQQIDVGGWPHQVVAPLTQADCFESFSALLRPLGCITQNRRSHPEGDVLYHSLQVFELLADQVPYDEEVLLAGLLHDVGRGIDPKNHVEAGLNALSGLISERTAWLLEHHMVARGLFDGTIGARARRRLVASDDFEEVELLARADLEGRQPGMRVRELDEALSYIRELGSEFDDVKTET
jgi:hypothetical protein